MDTKLTDFIRQLSVRDSKPLMGKVVKGTEELGELAAAVSSFENAPGGLHRFTGRPKILEEACDNILVALSIVYALGFTDAEMEEELHRKSVHWEGKQALEAGAQFPYPYEIHVTVASGELEAFRAACTGLGVKPVILDLHLAGGGTFKDVMTSSKFRGDNAGALAECTRIAAGMRAAGFDVVREKIETFPMHPCAPTDMPGGPKMPADCYFECHFNIVCSKQRRSLLEMVATGCDAHLSRNVFKQIDEDHFTIMATARSYTGTREAFDRRVKWMKGQLSEAGFPIEKEIVEFSIHDTKVSHDVAWLPSARAA